MLPKGSFTNTRGGSIPGGGSLTDITHPSPKDAFDLYKSLAWLAKCEAVMKLKLELKTGTLVALPGNRKWAATGELAETEQRNGEERSA